MKLKKALSGILAAAMVVSLTPAMAFATTSTSSSTVPTVKADENIPSVIKLLMEVKDTDGWGAEPQKFRVSFNNAEWDTNPTGVDTGNENKIGHGNNNATPDVTATVVAGTGGDATGVKFDFIASTDNSLELSVTPTGGTPKIAKGGYVVFEITAGSLKAGTEDGPVEVAINGLDSKVTSQTVTVANVGNSSTIATVNGTVKTFPRGDAAPKTTIEIRETAVNSIAADSRQTFELKLPKDITWKSMSVTNFAGDMANDYTAYDPSTNDDGIAISLSEDSRVLTVSFTVKAGSDTVRNVLVIKPSINISKDAAMGDIAVQVVGKSATPATADTLSDASDLVIAAYGDETISVTTQSEIPEIVAGYLNDTKSKNFTVQITVKESMKGALTAGRYVDFDFPEEVQICNKIKGRVGTSGNFANVGTGLLEVGSKNYDNANVIPNNSDDTADSYELGNKDDSVFSFLVPSANTTIGNGTFDVDKGNTVTFEVPVTVQADYEGDIVCTVSGAKAGVEETEVTVATVIPAVKVSADVTDVKNGVQKQTVANITIEENHAGYLDDTTDGNELVLSMDTLGLKGLVFEDYDTIEVTAGDIDLGKCKIGGENDDQIIIPIKSSSTKASTIEIKGAIVALNRTLPEGTYDLKIGGTALVKNAVYNDEDFDVAAAKVEGYVNIVTPAESTTVSEKVDAKFVIGEASYTNNGAATEMDAAAYIDSHNRTMVPIRYVANACGISENDIRWEQNTQTAIINGLNTVVTVKMGSNKLQTSTGEITMDTVAVNNNGRIYVPVRYIANALGANVSWDAATKTVTLTK